MTLVSIYSFTDSDQLYAQAINHNYIDLSLTTNCYRSYMSFDHMKKDEEY